MEKKYSAEQIILGYVDEAGKGVDIPATATKPARKTFKCHTVYYKPRKGMKSLNDTLRDAGFDPIVEVKALIDANVLFGTPAKGGFTICRVRDIEPKVKQSTKRNQELLEELLG